MSEKIVETVAQAIAQKQLDEGDGLYDWYALTDEVADGYRDLARAAIEAYEAAKAKAYVTLAEATRGVGSVSFEDAMKAAYTDGIANAWEGRKR